MNTFDLVIMLVLVFAVVTGFSTGLLRSALTIVAYLFAMPIAVWVMSYVPPLDEQYASPLGHNAGFFFGAFLLIGMALGKLARMMVDNAVGDDPSLLDRLGGAALGALRAGLIATSVVLVFDRMIPAGHQPSFLQGSQFRPIFSSIAKKGFRSLPPEAAAAIDRIQQRI
ncbi:MAG: CvpA family protein [Bradyrhizobium sp.]|uniref:CvpA family protein n=1 Tax=Bradyrhizobium sp. TaxID=376 RepID=UPI001D2C3C4D|nr:CvpA family protein [Bradyrhizobium sp.]MBV9561701.1 CvpA family protein [Bradyrhizobium sp.]